MYGITYKNILYLMPAWWACIARSVGMYRPLDGHVSPARWALADKSVISWVSYKTTHFKASCRQRYQ
jgi:hypothetical protein